MTIPHATPESITLAEPFGSERFRARLPELMTLAIAEARLATAPFGAVLADLRNGQPLVTGHNQSSADPTAHAEMEVLRVLNERHPDSDRGQLALISTAEPCPMCASAIWWARLGGLVFGTTIADLIRFGFVQLDLAVDALWQTATPARAIPVLGPFLADRTDPLYRDGPSRRPERSA